MIIQGEPVEMQLIQLVLPPPIGSELTSYSAGLIESQRGMDDFWPVHP